MIEKKNPFLDKECDLHTCKQGNTIESKKVEDMDANTE